MISYEGLLTKKQVVERATKHYKADEIMRGLYWDGVKGCNIGCIAESKSDPHERWSEVTGCPVWLGYLADFLFENMSLEDHKRFVVDFHKAIPAGKTEIDFERVKIRFLLYVLEGSKYSALKSVKKDSQSKSAVAGVVVLLKKKLGGKRVTLKEWEKARAAAVNDYTSAVDVSAVDAAVFYAAAAAYAVDAASAVDDYAVDAAVFYAVSAAYAVDAAAAASSVDDYAAQLLKLLKTMRRKNQFKESE